MGHEDGYFEGKWGDEMRAAEFFAEACSAKVANPDSPALLEELFPSAMREFDRLVEEMAR